MPPEEYRWFDKHRSASTLYVYTFDSHKIYELSFIVGTFMHIYTHIICSFFIWIQRLRVDHGKTQSPNCEMAIKLKTTQGILQFVSKNREFKNRTKKRVLKIDWNVLACHRVNVFWLMITRKKSKRKTKNSFKSIFHQLCPRHWKYGEN